MEYGYMYLPNKSTNFRWNVCAAESPMCYPIVLFFFISTRSLIISLSTSVRDYEYVYMCLPLLHHRFWLWYEPWGFSQLLLKASHSVNCYCSKKSIWSNGQKLPPLIVHTAVSTLVYINNCQHMSWQMLRTLTTACRPTEPDNTGSFAKNRVTCFGLCSV